MTRSLVSISAINRPLILPRIVTKWRLAWID